MHDDVLNAGGRLLGQFQIEPDASSPLAATAPARLHLSDSNLGRYRAYARGPLRQEGRDLCTQPLPIPSFEDVAASSSGQTRTNAHLQGVAAKRDLRRPVVGDKPKAITATPDEMALT